MSDLYKILVGEWTGSGVGGYPTIKAFEYLETLRFTLDEARQLVHYEQKARRRNVGQTEYVPSHWQLGFLRLMTDGQVEMANVQNSGRVEVLVGTVETTASGVVLRLHSSHIGNDPDVQETTRKIMVTGDTLDYTMQMQTTATPHLIIHLEAHLQRQ